MSAIQRASIEVMACNGQLVRVPLHTLALASERLAAIRADDRIDRIQKTCCRYFSVSRKAMRSPSRKAHLVRARQVAMYLVSALDIYSLPEIGRRFGGRDHTTALHGIRKISALAETDEQVNADLHALCDALAVAEMSA